MPEGIKELIKDFYAKNAPDKVDLLTDDAINNIAKTYGSDYKTLVKDLYAKYAPAKVDLLTEDTYNSIYDTYGLKKNPTQSVASDGASPSQNPNVQSPLGVRPFAKPAIAAPVDNGGLVAAPDLPQKQPVKIQNAPPQNAPSKYEDAVNQKIQESLVAKGDAVNDNVPDLPQIADKTIQAEDYQVKEKNRLSDSVHKEALDLFGKSNNGDELGAIRDYFDFEKAHNAPKILGNGSLSELYNVKAQIDKYERETGSKAAPGLYESLELKRNKYFAELTSEEQTLMASLRTAQGAEKEKIQTRLGEIKQTKGDVISPNIENTIEQNYDDIVKTLNPIKSKLPKDATPKDMFDMYYTTLIKKHDELAAKIGRGDESTFGEGLELGLRQGAKAVLPAGMSDMVYDADQKEYDNITHKLKALAPIYYANVSTLEKKGDQGSMEILKRKITGDLFPSLKGGYSLDTEKAHIAIEALHESGVAANPEIAKLIESKSENHDFTSKVAESTGGLISLMPSLMTAGLMVETGMGATGVNTLLQTLSKTPTFANKAFGFMIGAAKTGAEFKLATGAPMIEGASFHAGASAMGSLMGMMGKYGKFINPIVKELTAKTVGGAVGMTAGMQVSQLYNSYENHLADDDMVKEVMEESGLVHNTRDENGKIIKTDWKVSDFAKHKAIEIIAALPLGFLHMSGKDFDKQRLEYLKFANEVDQLAAKEKDPAKKAQMQEDVAFVRNLAENFEEVVSGNERQLKAIARINRVNEDNANENKAGDTGGNKQENANQGTLITKTGSSEQGIEGANETQLNVDPLNISEQSVESSSEIQPVHETGTGKESEQESFEKIANDGYITTVPFKGLNVRMSDLQVAEENLANGKNSVTPDEPVEVSFNISTGEKELSDGYHRYLNARGGSIEAAKNTDIDGGINAKIKFEITEKNSQGFSVTRNATAEEIAEAYNKAKKDGSNHDLVKTIDEFANQELKSPKVGEPQIQNPIIAENEESANELTQDEIAEFEKEKPSGEGVFGKIYEGLKGKAKKAVKFLFHKREGEVPAAFYRKEIGDIDLIWGEAPTVSKGFGLHHIDRKHGGEFPEGIAETISDVIENGTVERVVEEKRNRFHIDYKGYRVVIREDFDGKEKKWVVTAFENKKAAKTSSVGSTAKAVEETSLSSNSKDITNSDNNQVPESPELKEVNKQISEAEKEFTSAQEAFDRKRKELDKVIVKDQEDLFGDRKSQSKDKLFEERVDASQREKAIAGEKARLEKAKESLGKLREQKEKIENTPAQNLFGQGKKNQADISDTDFILDLESKGIFNLAGDVYADGRLDLRGMSTAEVTKGVNDIKKGNLTTAPAKKLIERINEMRSEDKVKVLLGTGGHTIYDYYTVQEYLDKINAGKEADIDNSLYIENKQAAEVLEETESKAIASEDLEQITEVEEQITEGEAKAVDELIKKYNDWDLIEAEFKDAIEGKGFNEFLGLNDKQQDYLKDKINENTNRSGQGEQKGADVEDSSLAEAGENQDARPEPVISGEREVVREIVRTDEAELSEQAKKLEAERQAQEEAAKIQENKDKAHARIEEDLKVLEAMSKDEKLKNSIPTKREAIKKRIDQFEKDELFDTKEADNYRNKVDGRKNVEADIPEIDETEAELIKKEIDKEDQKEVIKQSSIIGDLVKKLLTSNRGLGDRWMELVDFAKGERSWATRIIRNEIYNLRNACKKEKFTDTQAISNALADINGIDFAALPTSIQDVVRDMRTIIDGYSQKLVNNGHVSPIQADVIQNNIGEYLNRSFKLHTEKNYKPTKEAYNDAVTFIAQEELAKIKADPKNAGMTLQEMVDKSVAIAKQYATDIVTLKKDAKGQRYTEQFSKDLSMLMERKDIPEPIRKLMGEYTDPSIQFAITMSKLATLSSQGRLLNNLKDTYKGVLFFEKGHVRPEGFNYEVAADGSQTWNPLAGLYTSKNVIDALQESADTHMWVYKMYQKGFGLVKMGKTVYSIPTQSVNFFANPLISIANGHFNVTKLKHSWKYYKDTMFNGERGMDSLLETLVKKNVIGQSVDLRMIKDMMGKSNADEISLDEFINKPKSKLNPLTWIKGADQIFKKQYGASDSFWKAYGFMNEATGWSKAMFDKEYKDLTDVEKDKVDEIAAERIKNTYPTYDRALPGLMWVGKNIPLIGNFMAFQAEVIRTTKNNMAYAIKDLKDPNPKVKLMGAKRMGGIISYAGIKTGINYMAVMATGNAVSSLWASAFGSDDEETKRKNLDKFAPEYLETHNLAVTDLGNGKYRVVDLDRLDPYNSQWQTLNASSIGSGGGIGRMMQEEVKPFIELDMVANAVADINKNESYLGYAIYNEADDSWHQTMDKMAYLYRVIEPTSAKLIKRVKDSDKPAQEATLSLLGGRSYDIDVVKSFSSKVKDSQSKLSSNSTFSFFSENENDNKRYNENLKAVITEMHDLYKSALSIGANPKELNEILEKNFKMTKGASAIRSMIKRGNINSIQKAITQPRDKK